MEDVISDADKIIIALINQANTVAEVKAFQVDGRSKAVDDAINLRGTLLVDGADAVDKVSALMEVRDKGLTVHRPYAYYDDDGALHSWQPGTKLGEEDIEFLTERGVELTVRED